MCDAAATRKQVAVIPRCCAPYKDRSWRATLVADFCRPRAPKNAENCAQANGLRRVAMRFVCLRKATAGPPSSGKSNVCQPAVCASHPRRFPREHGVFPCSAAAAVASWSPGWPGARARVRPSAAVISKPSLCKAGGVREGRGEGVGKGGRQWGKGMRRGVLEPPPPDHPPTPNPPPRYLPLAC